MNSHGSGSEQARHPIGVAAERTGLTPEVMRVWERRYGVVEPVRGKGGQRLYSEDEVERLRLLRLVTRGGRSIGAVVGLSIAELARLAEEDELARLALATADPPWAAPAELEPALARARALDGRGLEAVLRRAAARVSATAFLEGTATPLLHRVGEEWHAGRMTVAQEHLATGVVQRVVLGIFASLVEEPEAPLMLVATPCGERHGLGGLLAAVAAMAEGWRVLYLGTDLPAAEIADAAASSGAEVVGLSVVYPSVPKATVGEIRAVRKRLAPAVPLLLGGSGASALAEALEIPGVRAVPDLERLCQVLRLRGR